MFFLATASPAQTADHDKIATAIAQLGDADFKIREAASRVLWNTGQTAEPALREALKSDDPEIASRAGEILADFKYGLYPDTPPDIAALVRFYRHGQPEQKREAVGGLTRLGRRAFPSLARLWAAETDAVFKAEIFRELSSRATETVPTFIADGEYIVAEQLLSAARGSATGSRNFGAYCALRGKTAEQVRALQDIAERPGDDGAQSAEQLAYLHRANGDLELARQAAQRSGNARLIDGILFELRDWKSLAERQREQARGSEDIESLGFLAAFERLSGQHAEFEKTLERIRAFGNKNPDSYRDVAEALILNDRPAEAIEIYKKKERYSAAFDLLAAQQRYTEALALAAKAREVKHAEAPALDAMAARVLHYLGEQEQSKKILDRLAEETAASAAPQAWANLVDAEYRAGMVDRAFEHCAKALELQRTKENPAILLARIFPDKSLRAEIWWNLLHEKSPDEKPLATLSRLRAIVDDKLPPAELEKLASDSMRNAVLLRRELALRVIGETLQAAGRDQAATTCFAALAELPSGYQGYLAMGALAAKRKDWRAAADFHSRALRRDPTQVVARYLYGHDLTQAGQEKEGREIMACAELIPLADDKERYVLAEALRKAGLADAARRQYQIITRTGDFMSWELGNSLRIAAHEASARGEHLLAANLWEQTTLDCLHINTSFIEQATYLGMPHLIHKSRALGLLSAGNAEAAWKEIQLCQDYLPADIDMPIELVPALEKAGRLREADELFARVMKLQRVLCEQYPNSSLCHNSLAWLAARCRRELDAALAHAQRAVELEPRNCAVIDTLAEVYFQRAEKNKAIETMKRCLELEPGVARHREQIKRFEKTNRDSPPPP
jgi:tetratricopeptide (TPR) repeat protein